MGIPTLKVRRTARGSRILTFLVKGRDNLAVRWMIRDAPATSDDGSIEEFMQTLRALPSDQEVTMACERRKTHPAGHPLVLRMSNKCRPDGAAELLDMAQRIASASSESSAQLGRRYHAAVFQLMRGNTPPIMELVDELEDRPPLLDQGEPTDRAVDG